MMKLSKTGKTKSVWEVNDQKVIIKFSDNIDTKGHDFNEKISGNAKLRIDFTERIFLYLEENGIKTHWCKRLDDTSIEVLNVKMIPLEVVVRNIAAGSVVKNYLLNEGEKLDCPMVNLYLKYGYLDPLIDFDLFIELKIGSKKEYNEIKDLAHKINKVLWVFFNNHGLVLIDFKMEFGWDKSGSLVLADEISPDCIRLKNKSTGNRIDKDEFRFGRAELLSILKKMNDFINVKE